MKWLLVILALSYVEGDFPDNATFDTEEACLETARKLIELNPNFTLTDFPLIDHAVIKAVVGCTEIEDDR